LKIPRHPIIAILGLACAFSTPGLATFPPLALKPISVAQIVSPVCIANAGDGSGRLFVCDQAGKIWIIRDEMLLPAPFLDLSSKLVPIATGYDERGLLGLAFHPNFNRRDNSNQPLPGFGKYYVFYSATSPNAPGTTTNPVNCRSTISEFKVSGSNADLGDITTERVVLSFDKPQSNHNGGDLHFGPDGYLYISVGDGGGQHDNQYGHTGGSGTTSPGPSGVLGNAQDKTKLLGKILRIDPLGTNPGQYTIPSSNPFVGVGGVREEIYTIGMRNPWRFSFDDAAGGTNRLIEGDVGQDSVEEVNILISGGNYGWRMKEGTFNHDATAPNGGGTLLDPIAQYAHVGVSIGSPALPQIGSAVVGGYVYRGSAIPALSGKYIFGDYSQAKAGANGTMLGLEEVPASSGNWVLSQLTLSGGNPLTTRIYAFGRDEPGELYVATNVTLGAKQLDSNGKPTGAIYKLVTSPLTLTRRETWLQQYFSPIGTYVDDLADLDGDGISNLLEYAYAYSPVSANPTGSGLQTSVAPSGANRAFTITFRRDPRATDLTYELQTSSDLTTWTTIVQSTAGAVPAGSGFVSEADAPGEAPVKNVTASELLAQGISRFARLKITRTY
jgi:glucose/arabinose dehydrogenase